MKAIYQSPLTEAMPINMTCTLCTSGESKVGFGGDKATGGPALAPKKY